MSYTNRKISAIMEFFSVSPECASYIYYRKKRGAPWRKPNDEKYLEWSDDLLEALIKCDSQIGMDWSKMNFGDEEIIMEMYGIYMGDKEEQKIPENEWTEVKGKHWFKKAKKCSSIVRSLGLI